MRSQFIHDVRYVLVMRIEQLFDLANQGLQGATNEERDILFSAIVSEQQEEMLDAMDLLLRVLPKDFVSHIKKLDSVLLVVHTDQQSINFTNAHFRKRLQSKARAGGTKPPFLPRQDRAQGSPSSITNQKRRSAQPQ